MGQYLARRLLTTLVVLLLVSFISFCIMQMVPGDPALVMAGAAAPADEEEQATTAVVVVLVLTGVLGEVLDALGEQRDLHLGGAGVALGRGVLGDDLLLDVGAQRHGATTLLRR